MDQLSETQVASLKKSSSDRLRLHLLKAGFSEDIVLSWSREELLEQYAQWLLKGQQVTEAGAASREDPQQERERWRHEERLKELEVELVRAQMERDSRRAELRQTGQNDGEDESAQLKRFGQALTHILASQPEEITDTPAWFRGVEDQFDRLQIPPEFRSRLIYKYLSTRSRALYSRLSPEIREDYDKMKTAILKDLGLSAKAFLERFNRIRKRPSDTFLLHESRLESLLRQYLEARKVDDFDKLINLLISDRIKSELSEQCLKHIVVLESVVDDGNWIEPKRLASIVDDYVTNMGPAMHPTSSFLGQPNESRRTNVPAVSVKPDKNWTEDRGVIPDNAKSHVNRSEPKTGGGRACFLCGSHFHLKANCDRKPSTGSIKRVNQTSAQPYQPTADSAGQRSNVTASANVNRVEVENSDFSFDSVLGDILNLFSVSEPKSVSEDPIAMSGVVDKHRVLANRECALHYVNIHVSDMYDNVSSINALFDSGAENSIIQLDAIKHLRYQSLGAVTLKSFDGHRSEGVLTSLNVQLATADESIPVRFVVCERVSHACLLSLHDYRRLLEQGKDADVRHDDNCVYGHCDETDDDALVNDANNVTSDDVVNDDAVSDMCNDDSLLIKDDANIVSPLPQNLVDPVLSSRDKLADDQRNDESLLGAFKLARENKGGYFLENNLLFHQTKLLGQTVDRLVVPCDRRKSILDLAHNLVGGHMGVRRTKERIALSFMWPNLINDVIDYCRSCEICQRRAKVTCYDRVPIQSGVVSTEPVFSHLYVDCFGPLCSYPIQYNYAIVFLDQVSRYPHCVPLRSITAKNCCEAMLAFWQHTGFPTKVTMDRATNFFGDLTRHFLQRVGCSPIFCTPRHPEANSVERTVGTIKSMIAKVAQEHPRSWHRYLDLILWGLRESVNETTGVSPYTMVFGRLPHGPLAVLRDIWTGEDKFPVPKNRSTTEFLKDLRDRLETARTYAEAHAGKEEQRHVDRYNRRAREKSFTVGEYVLVLQKDSTASKVFSKWIGPAVVTEIQSPHSYVVEFDDGSRRIIHANHLRKFHTRIQAVTCDAQELISLCDVNTCALIGDQDEGFGDIQVMDGSMKDSASELLPSQVIRRDSLSHLSAEQQAELLQLLDKYACCFSDTPGLTIRVEHAIELTADFKPKRMREYKVPEYLKPEVERQLEQMLADGIITESTSAMCSPLVLVKKGKSFADGIRLAVDYRYLNSFTVCDAFPIPDIEDVIQRVGGKKYITTFDCRHGYWQTLCRKSDRWLSAFVCLGRLYEFTRTPFGMKNAGQTFVRAMQQILHPLRKFADSFVDDCAVSSDSWVEHLVHLDSYLSTMLREGITLNLKKCQFAKQKVKFCGEIIGSGTRQPDPEKVLAIKEIVVPDTKRQLRGMLGLFSYFRKYVPSLAAKAKILTDLTSKRAPQNLKLQWTEKHTEALETLKQELSEACQRPLYTVQFDRPFHIHVDASQDACGGLICQLDDEGAERPIAFFSTKFSKTQRNWATIEREAYAVLVALKRYRHWILGSKVIVVCDHNPLTYLTASAPKSAKLMRWSLALAEFEIEFKYQAGKLNVAADALSRPGQQLQPADKGEYDV